MNDPVRFLVPAGKDRPITRMPHCPQVVPLALIRGGPKPKAKGMHHLKYRGKFRIAVG